jgi:hypothetical protein
VGSLTFSSSNFRYNPIFSDLYLSRDLDGSISFYWGVVQHICEASGLPTEISSDNVARLLVGWYQTYRQNGGSPDSVADELIAEVLAEENMGQKVSYNPGHS